jgi:succinoglycan biosynthesis protein ExoA
MLPAMPPTVSIIVPCYNEQATIRFLLDAILEQTYPRRQMDVVIADGLSQDSTRERIGAFQKAHPDLVVRIVDNPQRTIPSGLNLACAAARGEMLVRLDAHSIPISEYVERCVGDLENGSGSVVGGVWLIRPGGVGPVADGIAEAASNPLGVGDAMYRTKAKAGSVDTVPFGAFRRSLYEKMSGFDERLLTNEDYEFNTRVRREGGVVWLDPNIRSTYIARSSLPALARQYWRYGYWKLKMLRRHPDSIRWRQALPPVFVTSLIALGLLSFVLPLARFLLLAEIAAYVLVLLLAGIVVAMRRRKGSLAFGLPLAIATMHLAWGSGFLSSLLAVTPEEHG